MTLRSPGCHPRTQGEVIRLYGIVRPLIVTKKETSLISVTRVDYLVCLVHVLLRVFVLFLQYVLQFE